MSAVGWLHGGSMLRGPDCLIASCRSRTTQVSSRPLGFQIVSQDAVESRPRCFSSVATSRGTAVQSAASQQQLQPAPQLQQHQDHQQQQQQQHQSAAELQQHQQQEQAAECLQEQQETAASQHIRQQHRQQQRVNTTAVDKPEVVTAAISRARSIEQLHSLLATHGSRLNHIHISAAFVQLQRLWTSSSSSSNDAADGFTPLSSSSNGASQSSSSGNRRHQVSPRSTLQQLQQLAQGLQRVDSRYCANVLYSIALLEQRDPAAYCAPLIEQICAASYDLANLMSPQELATLVWSLALLDIEPSEQLLRRLVSNILRKLPGFGPQDLVMTLSALPRLSLDHAAVAPYSTVHKLAAAAARQLPAASPLETSLLLAVLAGVHYRPNAAWLSAFWAATDAKLRHMGPAEIGMAGWALGRLSPLLQQPPQSWLHSWQEAVAAACISGSRQQHESQHKSIISSSSRSGSCSNSRGQLALVELVMAVYGWSKAVPDQPPSPEFQQLLYCVTQEAMASGSSVHSVTLQQQHRQHQRQQRASLQQQIRQEQGTNLSSMVLQQSQQQFAPQQQQQQHEADLQDSSDSTGVSSRLLIELLVAAARWQQLPPRPWLLDALRLLQQQLANGSCSSRDVSNLLWALASLGIQPNQEWMHTCTGALQQQLQRHRQQQQQGDTEQRLQPRQLAIALWALNRLGYTAGETAPQFWSNFWAASYPLLSKKFTLADLAMTLEGAVQQRQQPPVTWMQTALAAAVRKAAGAAAELTPLPAAGAAAARSAVGSTAERKQAKKQQGQQRQRQVLQRAAAAGVLEGRSSAARVGPDLVRLATAAARLGAVPGHQWCCQLLHALQPAAQQLDQQAICRLVWCLGKLGYRPAGGGLTGWLAARLSGPTTSLAPGSMYASSSSQLGLLLSGLRGSGVVLGGQWLQQLLLYSQQAAAHMPVEVLVQLIRYVAAARIRPPTDWSAAALTAVEAALTNQQQQQLPSLPGLLVAMVQLRLVPSQQLLQQLQQQSEAMQQQLTAEQAAVQLKCLQKLQQLRETAEVQQQEQQQEADLSTGTAVLQQQQVHSNPADVRERNAARQQQQQSSQQGVNDSTINSRRGSSTRNGYGKSSGSNGIINGSSSSSSWTGAMWVASKSSSDSAGGSSLSVSAAAAATNGICDTTEADC